MVSWVFKNESFKQKNYLLDNCRMSYTWTIINATYIHTYVTQFNLCNNNVSSNETPIMVMNYLVNFIILCSLNLQFVSCYITSRLVLVAQILCNWITTCNFFQVTFYGYESIPGTVLDIHYWRSLVKVYFLASDIISTCLLVTFNSTYCCSTFLVRYNYRDNYIM